MGTYRNYLRLLESWPLDNSKAGSDLGQHIRDQLKIAFAKGEVSNEIDRKLCDRYYKSLKKISINYYGKKYPRIHSSSASGLDRELCNFALRPEVLEYIAEQNRGFVSRMISLVVNYYNGRKVSN